MIFSLLQPPNLFFIIQGSNFDLVFHCMQTDAAQRLSILKRGLWRGKVRFSFFLSFERRLTLYNSCSHSHNQSLCNSFTISQTFYFIFFLICYSDLEYHFILLKVFNGMTNSEFLTQCIFFLHTYSTLYWVFVSGVVFIGWRAI